MCILCLTSTIEVRRRCSQSKDKFYSVSALRMIRIWSARVVEVTLQ